ncbi:molybdenum cofactor guanylyltransferase MobA [Halopseudomonas pelagia]|uniref:Molybdenum cofactor guanylyltransferase n=1 Tax=Halopseudomonas pelagia TaxID=553151 RepID=A0AA91U314_9GAMM|nr:molybdenum cofactor guanylyltransferase MobA [Halopseudomonas pelagia]PCC99704.1 molybdenum cofactor guanylyltransferase MobA [Halopseudomonas pelagia]QFY56433.1 molybdenum cofactor guanylyltransferase MobA [Halopseudomonas pelagia]
MSVISNKQLSLLLLAGGQGSRLGGRDKGLMPWQGQPIAAHLIALIRPLVSEVIISCNRNHALYQSWADQLVSDPGPDYPGPLAGILSGLNACKGSHLLVVPCDLPHLDQALLIELIEHAASKPCIPNLIKTSETWQPLVSVIPRNVLPDLQLAWKQGQRSPLRWMLGQAHGILALAADDPRLHNANRVEDWQ